MRVRAEHLHPVHEFSRFATPRFKVFSIADEDGYSFSSAPLEILPFLPAENFKLYVRWGFIAKLITALELRELKILIEIECNKQGVRRRDLPELGEFVTINHDHYRREYQEPKEVVGKGISESQIRREMRMMLAPGSHTKQEWREIMLRDGWKCLRCGSTKKLSKDHVVPIAGGGTNDAGNLQTLCTPCNSWKGARHIDFRPQAEVIAQNR